MYVKKCRAHAAQFFVYVMLLVVSCPYRESVSEYRFLLNKLFLNSKPPEID